jgi:hypothetical protein
MPPNGIRPRTASPAIHTHAMSTTGAKRRRATSTMPIAATPMNSDSNTASAIQGSVCTSEDTQCSSGTKMPIENRNP